MRLKTLIAKGRGKADFRNGACGFGQIAEAGEAANNYFSGKPLSFIELTPWDYTSSPVVVQLFFKIYSDAG